MIKECNFAHGKTKRDIRARLEHVGRRGITWLLTHINPYSK